MWAIACLWVCPAWSQTSFGNEWIDYNQQYWRFQVAQNGVYRLDYNTLLAYGIPVNAVSPNDLHLYTRAREQACRIELGEDGLFNQGDYIEFYGRKNDAWLDSLMYEQPGWLPNPEYSLFNDTASYFITINPGTPRRTQLIDSGNYGAHPSATHCRFTVTQTFANTYQVGRQDPNGISLPWYEAAEGWFDYPFSKGQSHVTNLPTNYIYAEGLATVKTICAPTSSAQGYPNHHLQIGYGGNFQLMRDTIYFGYQLNKTSFTIAPGQMTSVTPIVHRSIDDLNVAADNHAVSYVSIDYPRMFTFPGQNAVSFVVQNTWGDDSVHIELNAPDLAAARLFVVGEAFEKEITLEGGQGIFQALVPFGGLANVKLMLIPSNDYSVVDDIEPVSSTGYFTNYASDEVTDAMIIITHPKLWNAAQNYTAYRTVNGRNVMLVNVEELYMQYAAGIWKHPLAIRRFCDHLLQSWNSDPKHLFLIGKSIHEMPLSGNGSRNSADEYKRNLVPTWGWPSSDACFTSGLNGTLYSDAIPTGRLAANDQEQVLEYLNKVVEMESQSPALWQKNVLHFGGGSVLYEQQMFSGYLNSYAVMARDTSFGGKVYTFLKNTAEPIQMNLSDSIQLLINEGAALMTFFGHASSTGFDQNIDSPQSYNNQGKYPLLIGNSCYTGNIHLSESTSTSENFVLAPARGVIGFIAKSDLGIPTYLDLYTRNLYRNLFQEMYGQSIGECMADAVREFEVAEDFYRENHALTFALHGDPALVLYGWQKPDYAISANSISFSPENVTASVDSFEVRVAVSNLGKAVNAALGVELVRHYPNGVDSVYFKQVPSIYFRDTIVFTLPIDPLYGVGENRFDVRIDYPQNTIDELEDVSNNLVFNRSLLITSGDLIPVYPHEFAVVPDAHITLKASSAYVLEPSTQYRIEIDTTDYFNSPAKLTHTAISQGGVVTWELPINLTDSTVYFWRCSRDSISPEQTFSWRNSSFQYLADRTGWGQAHFFQFEKDPLQRMEYSRSNREWTFSTDEVALKCEVYGGASTNFEALGTRYQIDLDVQDYSGPGFVPCLMAAVMDSVSLLPWESNYNNSNPDHDFGNTLESANARHRPEKYFIFKQDDPLQLEGLANMITTGVPDGNYLLVYTWMYGVYSQWPQSLKDAFASAGASSIGIGQDSVPFIFFVKKGSPATAQEVYGTEAHQYLELSSSMQGSDGRGNIISLSSNIGSNWSGIDWKALGAEASGSDSLLISLEGLSASAAPVSIYSSNEHSGESVLSNVNANALRWRAELSDGTLQTPLQMEYWHIYHEPAPECALNPVVGYYFSSDTVAQGESIRVAIAVQNISSVPMDSLLVHYTIEKSDGSVEVLNYPRQAPLGVNQVLLDTLEINTSALSGFNLLRIEANPFVSNGVTDQPELYHFNNLAQLPFYVNTDRINPLLDVTFDGMHLMNGDIVSTNPFILVSLMDENPFLLLNEEADTSHFKIYLTTPSRAQVPVYFSRSDVRFIPAQGSKNKCKIEFTPTLKEDGRYSFLVQASDKSDNASGKFDYRIDFDVNSKPGITEVLNYPNPFSTRTQFVFTLTGSEVPDEMKIQIMTVSGTIVREILQSELGPLRIGRNMTEYWWDGRDEYGDQLANGVYLYRVVARLNGQELEINSTAAGGYFQHGFGKMYLLR